MELLSVDIANVQSLQDLFTTKLGPNRSEMLLINPTSGKAAVQSPHHHHSFSWIYKGGGDNDGSTSNDDVTTATTKITPILSGILKAHQYMHDVVGDGSTSVVLLSSRLMYVC